MGTYSIEFRSWTIPTVAAVFGATRKMDWRSEPARRGQDLVAGIAVMEWTRRVSCHQNMPPKCREDKAQSKGNPFGAMTQKESDGQCLPEKPADGASQTELSGNNGVWSQTYEDGMCRNLS